MTQTAEDKATDLSTGQTDIKFTGFPGSTKKYKTGSRPDIRVPVREVALMPTTGRSGPEENPPVQLYDTSGPYTDTSAATDVRRGLPALRRAWVLARGDVEEYEGRPVGERDDGRRGVRASLGNTAGGVSPSPQPSPVKGEGGRASSPPPLSSRRACTISSR